MGKIIYKPTGKAKEYSDFAANFYCGCTNGCTYCYLKKGVLSKKCGGKPELKLFPGGKSEALNVFKSELIAVKDKLDNGLFFSFTTDPLLPETIDITLDAIDICQQHNIPVKVLSKRGDSIDKLIDFSSSKNWNPSLIAFGMTLTGCDDLEPFASLNSKRVTALSIANSFGFRTFASIEPIPPTRFYNAYFIISASYNFVNQYKIGLQSGRSYAKSEVLEFVGNVNSLLNPMNNPNISNAPAVYWKDSILNVLQLSRSEVYNWYNSVDSEYNLFNHTNENFKKLCNSK